jgi:hypothetical protein
LTAVVEVAKGVPWQDVSAGPNSWNVMVPVGADPPVKVAFAEISTPESTKPDDWVVVWIDGDESGWVGGGGTDPAGGVQVTVIWPLPSLPIVDVELHGVVPVARQFAPAVMTTSLALWAA